MKNIVKILAAASICGMAVVGCEKNFVDYNTNKYEVTEEQLQSDNLAFNTYVSQLERRVIIHADGELLDSDYQVCYALCADAWAGYLSTTPFRDGVNTGSYYMVDAWTKSLWTRKYENTINAWTKLNTLAIKAGNAPVEALGNILKVLNMHQVADAYGAIPYSEVGIELSPKYDPLEDIYTQFFKELDSAIEVLTDYYTAGNTSIMAKADRIFGGDVTKWIKFANSLRLRLAMRVVYANPSLAQKEAEASLAHALGVIEANADNAVLSGVNHHPTYEINVNFNDGDCQLNANLDCYLNGYADPRTAKIAKMASDGKFHGVRNGVHTSVFTPYRNSSGLVSAPNATNYQLMFLNAAEVWFLRAEGALRGWAMKTDAKDAYTKGIAASFEEWGVSGADTYAADNTKKPVAFVDNTGKGADCAAPSSVTIAFDGSNFETALEKIMTQKWIALFPNGSEAWAEVRRTGYPKLVVPVNNDSNGIVKNEMGVRRIPYPQTEYQTNPKGVASGVSVLGGADNAATRIWWDKKN